MIGSSRRRSAVGRSAAGHGFKLHVAEARSASLHRRLLHASVAALAAALILLLLPATLPVRAVAVVAAALAGLAWPPRDAKPSALASIRLQTGLSYETALGLLERRKQSEPAVATESNGAKADPYGLEQAVLERADRNIRGYESQPRPAWWLPALVVAGSLVLLPDLLPAATSSQAGAGVTAPAGATDAALEAEPPLEPAPPEPPAPGRAEPPVAAPGQDDDGGDTPVSDLPEGDVEGQAPLSRYLQSLRERPAATGAPTDGSATADEASEADSQTQSEEGSDLGQGDGGGTGDEADRDNTGSGTDQASDGSDPSGGPDSAQQSEDGATEGEGSAQAAGDEAEPGGQLGADQLDEGEFGAGSDEGTSADVAGGSGDPDGGAEGAESAGVGGSEGGEELLVPQGAGGSQEQLPGVLSAGPETVAGSVRLPGSTDVELPPGTRYAPYQSAAEDALTEGDLPLDYQEIIRRYFR